MKLFYCFNYCINNKVQDIFIYTKIHPISNMNLIKSCMYVQQKMCLNHKMEMWKIKFIQR